MRESSLVSLFAALGVAATLASCGVAHAGPGRSDKDAVVEAMAQELKRSRARLQLEGFEHPYYVAYAIKEQRQHAIVGKRGAILADRFRQSRRAYVDVRVGDYRFDSSEDDEGEWLEEGVYEPDSDVSLEDDPLAIRHTLWLLTDLRYKQALSSYMKLKGKMVYAPKKQKRPSFSMAPANKRLEKPPKLTIDRDRWLALVRRLGKRVAQDPEVFDGQVNLSFGVETRWFVNTEGARIRTALPMYAFHVTAFSRTSDGALVDQSVDYYAPTEAGLPSDKQLVERTERLIADLAALRAAPSFEPYTGPAILESSATGVFFHEVLGHRLEGHRQDNDEEGKTFAAYLNKKILPEFLSLIDDPTKPTHGKQPLNGHYAFDDEGVAAERVVLVDRGVLKNFLLPRRPVEGFSRSNGHGRAQGVVRPVARQGNLIVKAHQTVSRKRLRQMLLEEARRQKKPFGLIVRDITGGATNTSSYGFQAFKGDARMVYKIDAATGAETLVRGVEIVGTPLVSLGKVIAASENSGVFNGYCGAESGMVPVSTVAPAVLFSEIELQRSGRTPSKGPILEAPTIWPRPAP